MFGYVIKLKATKDGKKWGKELNSGMCLVLSPGSLCKKFFGLRSTEQEQIKALKDLTAATQVLTSHIEHVTVSGKNVERLTKPTDLNKR